MEIHVHSLILSVQTPMLELAPVQSTPAYLQRRGNSCEEYTLQNPKTTSGLRPRLCSSSRRGLVRILSTCPPCGCSCACPAAHGIRAGPRFLPHRGACRALLRSLQSRDGLSRLAVLGAAFCRCPFSWGPTQLFGFCIHNRYFRL